MEYDGTEYNPEHHKGETMSYKKYKKKNPLIAKVYSKESTDIQARLAYNAGANDGFNFIFWPLLAVIGILFWCLI